MRDFYWRQSSWLISLNGFILWLKPVIFGCGQATPEHPVVVFVEGCRVNDACFLFSKLPKKNIDVH